MSLFKESRWESARLIDCLHKLSERQESTCANCGAPGTEPAHANWGEMGKGKGLKAHDCFIAELCHLCHMYVDNQQTQDTTGVYGNSAEDRKECWTRAYLVTMLRWARRGWIKPSV
ncbi:MAG: hypothetical protein ACXWG8_10265 [Usitatibacter sp.]